MVYYVIWGITAYKHEFSKDKVDKSSEMMFFLTEDGNANNHVSSLKSTDCDNKRLDLVDSRGHGIDSRTQISPSASCYRLVNTHAH